MPSKQMCYSRPVRHLVHCHVIDCGVKNCLFGTEFYHDSERSPCELVLSDTHKGDAPRLLYIYKRWISSIYTIKGQLHIELDVRITLFPFPG